MRPTPAECDHVQRQIGPYHRECACGETGSRWVRTTTLPLKPLDLTRLAHLCDQQIRQSQETIDT